MTNRQLLDRSSIRSSNALVTVELLTNSLGLQVEVAEETRDDPALHRGRNEWDGDDEISVNLSRSPIVLEVERDIRLTMKPTRWVFRCEGELTSTSACVRFNLLNPAQLVTTDKPSAQWVKSADECESQPQRCATAITSPAQHLRLAQVRKLKIGIETGVDHCRHNVDRRRGEVVLGMELHADHALAVLWSAFLLYVGYTTALDLSTRREDVRVTQGLGPPESWRFVVRGRPLERAVRRSA